MVIELTKISQKRLKTIEDLNQNTGKPKRDMDGQNWRELKWMHLGKFEKRRPTFFKFISAYIKMSFTQLEIILSCYVGVILQMKDFCSANLTFRAHN